MAGMDMAAMGMAWPPMGMDLNDIEYDAYLANDRTLDDPEVVARRARRTRPAAHHQRRNGDRLHHRSRAHSRAS